MEFTATIPSDLKQKNGIPKYMLRKYLTNFNLLPREIIYQQKHGFTAPIEYWLKDELKEVASQILDNRHLRMIPFLNRAHVKKSLNITNRIQAEKLWTLLSFAIWYKMFIVNEDLYNPSLNLRNYC